MVSLFTGGLSATTLSCHVSCLASMRTFTPDKRKQKEIGVLQQFFRNSESPSFGSSTISTRQMEDLFDQPELNLVAEGDSEWDLSQVDFSSFPSDDFEDWRGPEMETDTYVPATIQNTKADDAVTAVNSNRASSVHVMALFLDDEQKSKRVMDVVADLNSFFKSETIFFEGSDSVYRLALFIDDRQKPERIQKFVSEFNSCFETEEGRRSLTSLDPVLLGATPGLAAARFLEKYNSQSTL